MCAKNLFSALGALGALTITLVKALNASTSVDELLLASKERVTLVAQFDGESSTFTTAGLKCIAARALHSDVGVLGVCVALHVCGISSKRTLQCIGT